VINGANDFLSALKDAETSARDYLLRGDEADLKLYLVEHDSTRRRLKEVRQLTLLSAAQKDLDTMTPLVDAILAELSHVIELRRNHDLNGALAIERNGEGRRLMHSIRAEMHGFMTLEEGLLVQREAELQASLRNLACPHGCHQPAGVAGCICVSLFDSSGNGAAAQESGSSRNTAFARDSAGDEYKTAAGQRLLAGPRGRTRRQEPGAGERQVRGGKSQLGKIGIPRRHES